MESIENCLYKHAICYYKFNGLLAIKELNITFNLISKRKSRVACEQSTKYMYSYRKFTV